MNSNFRGRWLASSEVISQVLFTSEQPKKNKMAFIIIIYLPLYYNTLKKENKKINNNNTVTIIIYSKLLGEETSRNPQAYRRGHLNITILNKIRAAKECGRNFCRYIVSNKVALWVASYSACVVYTKTIMPLSVGESCGYLPRRFAARWISTTFTDTEVNNCFSIYHTSWIASGPKINFICKNIATKAILVFFGCSEVNSTWLITSELANQRARKVLFTCVVYTNNTY